MGGVDCLIQTHADPPPPSYKQHTPCFIEETSENVNDIIGVNNVS